MAIQTGPEEDIAVTMARIRLSFRGTKQAEMRHDCMRRDGNRCVVTGVFDNDHLKTLPQQIRQGKPGGSLQCAYILPFGLTILNEANELEVGLSTYSVTTRDGRWSSRWLTSSRQRRSARRVPSGGLYTGIFPTLAMIELAQAVSIRGKMV